MENKAEAETSGTVEALLKLVEQEERWLDLARGHLASSKAREGEAAALALAELVAERLASQGRLGEGLRLLAIASGWYDHKATADFRKKASKLVEVDREKLEFLDHVGFEASKAPALALHRLATLCSLKRGTLCLDKSWGFGVVQDVDLFYHQIHVDFTRKKGHQLSLTYAGETLELIHDNHILARRHKQPDVLSKLVESDPAEVVRIALRSYGPMPAPQLQERLVPAVVADKDWKRFWEVARRDLKKDGLAEVPAKRTDPIRLLEKQKAYDTEWFAKLRANNNLPSVLDAVTEFVDSPDRPAVLEDPVRLVLADRLGFLIKGSDPKHPGFVARGLMLASKLEIQPLGYEVRTESKKFLDPRLLNRTMEQLPAKYLQPFLRFLVDQDRDATLVLLAREIPKLEPGVLNEAVATLIAYGSEAAARKVFKQAFDRQEPGIVMVNWVSRNTDRLVQWELGDFPMLANLMLARIEDQANGEILRAQNQLRERLAKGDFLQEVLDSMTSGQRYEFAIKLKDTAGIETMDKRSMLGKAIKLYPELQEVTATRSSQNQEAARKPMFTSTRTYGERQEQMRKLVKVEIPENSKDIGVARSYGDLKENHEFKAAKEKQRILMRRQGELEKMLSEVNPTDFRNFPTDKIGPATGVVLEYADGRSETYYILGEWDRDEKLGIISCNAKLAQVLSGHVAGDHVTIPTESGEASCTVKAVLPLHEGIYAWIDTVPASVNVGAE